VTGSPIQFSDNTNNTKDSLPPVERLLNLAPNIVIGLGENSRILLFNEYAEKLLGYKASEVLGKSWIDTFVPEGMRENLYKVWNDVVNNKKIEHQYENPVLTKDGTPKLISWNNSVITEGDKFKMVLSIGIDVI